MEDKKEMMTAKEAAKAMEWAKANGHTDKEAIDLINFITGNKPLNEDTPETKE